MAVLKTWRPTPYHLGAGPVALDQDGSKKVQLLLDDLVELLRDIIPVDVVPERLHILWSKVLVVHVVSVLPYVQNGQDLESGEDVDVVLFDLHYHRSLNPRRWWRWR
jgi:hypothetical protein